MLCLKDAQTLVEPGQNLLLIKFAPVGHDWLETPECLCGRPPVPRTDHEIGETVCDKCGKVLGMMQEVPHTADNRSIAPNRANATEIHGGSSSLQRAIRVSRKTDVMGVNISLSIRAGCDKLGLPRSVKQRSIELVSNQGTC